MRFRFFGFLSFLLITGTTAKADTLTTFYLSSTLDPSAGVGANVTGTVVLDETTGIFTGSNLVGRYFGGTYSITGAPTSYGLSGGGGASYANFGTFGQTYFGLVLPGNTLIGYAGGALCSDLMPCSVMAGTAHSTSGAGIGYSFDVASGTLSLNPPISAATPEPSSLMLLSTGICGFAGLVRRRFAI